MRRFVFPQVFIFIFAAASLVLAQSPPVPSAPATSASPSAEVASAPPAPTGTPASAPPASAPDEKPAALPETHAPAGTEQTATKGFSYATSFSGDRNATAGWSTVMDSNVSYDFNRIFGVTLGMPFYMSHNGYDGNVAVKGNNLPPLVTTYNAPGDLYLDLKFSAPDSWIGYKATIAGTAPTGDTSSGISTGRPTFDLNNHVEHAWGFFTPLAEFGIGDSSALVNRRVRRPYTTLGPLSHFKAGADFAFLKAFDFETAGYEDLPVGNQKVYSHLFIKLQTPIVLPGGRVKRYRQVRVDTGDGILEDNGLTNTLTISLGKHVDLSGIYQRSLRQSLDTVQVGIGFHFGRSSEKTSL